MKICEGRVHVAEIYSPPRVTAEARNLCLIPGFALDMQVEKTTGVPWNFGLAEHRDEARMLLGTQRPRLCTGSPECRIWNALQHVSESRRLPGELMRMRIAAELHVQFCAAMYRAPIREGRYFLHEQPRFAARL